MTPELTLFTLESTPPQPPATDYWLHLLEQKLGATPALHNCLRHNRCPTCNTWILEGYDHHRTGKHTRLHPRLATPNQETACILLNIPTYQLWGPPGDWTITTRYEPNIPPLEPHPSADQVNVIHAHRCGLHLATRPLPRPATTSNSYTDTPPF
ncbi:hypothetical protein [Timonella senegalensis]|uniref:hypothetical protein n=1 Tax=Timonella senegalensis TaxID=1465825 RepID=UPI002FE1341A